MAMIIPMSPGQKQGTQPQAQPSQTDLLMALAEMKKQGRFDPNPKAGKEGAVGTSSHLHAAPISSEAD